MVPATVRISYLPQMKRVYDLHGPMRQLYPERKASKPAAFLMMFHGVETTQKTHMKTVPRKMLMYFGANPEMSLLNGYEPKRVSIDL
jgi:hypothetical protein